jgi:hypothetical protein
MKNTTAVFVLFVLFSLCPDIYSLDTAAAKYFPLVIGNTYIYRSTSSGPGGQDSYYFREVIEKDSVFNGHKYYKFVVYSPGSVSASWYRIDSATTNLMGFSRRDSNCALHPYESLVDSLRSRKGDNSYHGCFGSPPTNCNDTAFATLFGITTQKKGFIIVPGNGSSGITYMKYIGDVFAYTGFSQFFSSRELKGCILNGIVYGDTAMPLTGVHQLSVEIPAAFSLGQNYPNPFNPVTKIQFDVPFLSSVKITVYDIAGRVVTVLADEELSPSVYSVDFDASLITSGVYMYRIEARSIENGSVFSQSKKMVVIK